MKWLRPALAMATATLLLTPLTAQNLEADLQRAVQRETTTGDLAGAITEYQRIADRAASNRAVAARALLRMAQAKEKRGDREAAAVYERIVTQFATETEAVATAKRRLTTAARPTASLRATGATAQTSLNPRYWSTGPDVPDSFSPDGRTAVGVSRDLAHLQLYLQNLATGERRVLVSRINNERPGTARMSPDGRWLAYPWLTYVPRTLGLRVIGTARGSEGRTLIPQQDQNGVRVIGWTPDSASILIELRRGQRPAEQSATSLAWVNASDGTVRIIKTFDNWRMGPQGGLAAVSLSPDGSTIVYTANAQQGSSDRYIFALNARTYLINP